MATEGGLVWLVIQYDNVEHMTKKFMDVTDLERSLSVQYNIENSSYPKYIKIYKKTPSKK